MQFESLSAFFDMGGYAFYVWLAYGVTFSCISMLIVVSARKQKKVLHEISKKMDREEKLKNNRSNQS